MPSEISEGNGTGPFRRVLSKTGFAYEEADIFLPDTNSISTLNSNGELKASGDTVFIYMGGRGSNGGEVDAGFQYSARFDNWSLFMSVSGFGFTFGPTPADPAHPRFAAGQTIHLEFEVIANNLLEVRATGNLIGAIAPATLAITINVSTFPVGNSNVDADRAGQPTNFQWNASGAGNRLKRVTSIGQTAGSQNFNSGSFVQGVVWNNCRIGRTSTATALWTAADVSTFTSSPNNGRVEVDFISQSHEIVSIDL